jgi:hypothetical protein
MKIAVSGRGAINASTLNALLKRADLRYPDDVQLRFIQVQDHVDALRYKLG